MKLTFCNNGIISLEDLTTMGDSSKRSNTDKIGRFDSGLKYALCILFRNDVNIHIKSGNYKYILNQIQSDRKELLVINQYDNYNILVNSVTTSFSIELGYNWELWMAVRELYSNMKDENGYFLPITHVDDSSYDTIISIDSPLLDDVYNKWNDYFLEQDPINTDSNDKCLVYDNLSEDGLLRIYKQNILIYTDKSIKSKFVYNCSEAEIDERRVLSNYYEVRSSIATFICSTKDINVIKAFCKLACADYFENDISYNRYSFSKEWVDYVNENQPQNLMRSLRYELIQMNNVNLQSKVVQATRDWYSPKIEIINTKVEPATALEILEQECKAINFEIKYKVQESIIKTYKAAASTFDKVIYIDSSFTTEDMWQFIKAHYVLDSSNMDKIYKDYYLLLKNKI
jgi:hypothetical protein